MRILSLCDNSGIMVKPWFNAGHTTLTVDLDTPQHQMPNIQCDINDFNLNEKFDIVFAFPPCTHLAGSGARWWKHKGDKALQEGLQLVQRCIDIAKQVEAKWWLIENPVGRLSTYWRKPDYWYHPFQYNQLSNNGDELYSKKTCLWTNKNSQFIMPKPCEYDKSKVDWLRIRDGGWCKNSMRIRSNTPSGFANAVYQSNKEASNA